MLYHQSDPNGGIVFLLLDEIDSCDYSWLEATHPPPHHHHHQFRTTTTQTVPSWVSSTEQWTHKRRLTLFDIPNCPHAAASVQVHGSEWLPVTHK